MLIACQECPARHIECEDCVITALLNQPAAGPTTMEVDRVEARAISCLVAAGMVTATVAAQARAERTDLRWHAVG